MAADMDVDVDMDINLDVAGHEYEDDSFVSSASSMSAMDLADSPDNQPGTAAAHNLRKQHRSCERPIYGCHQRRVATGSSQSTPTWSR